MIRVSKPALKVIPLMVSAANKSVTTAKANAAPIPYRLKINTIAIIRGREIIVPKMTTFIRLTLVAPEMTLVIPANLGHKIKRPKATAAIRVAFKTLLSMSVYNHSLPLHRLSNDLSFGERSQEVINIAG
jgi:hypothetical protein